MKLRVGNLFGFGCAMLFLACATQAFAVEGNPVGGVGVSVENSPGGIVIATGKTDGKGNVTFRDLRPGTYAVKCISESCKGKVLQTTTLKATGPVAVTVTSAMVSSPITSKASQ